VEDLLVRDRPGASTSKPALGVYPSLVSFGPVFASPSLVGFKPLARASGGILLQAVGITSQRYAVLCHLNGRCIEIPVEKLQVLKNGVMLLQLQALTEGLTGLAYIEIVQESATQVVSTHSIPVLLTDLDEVAHEVSSFKGSRHNPSLQQMRCLVEVP